MLAPYILQQQTGITICVWICLHKTQMFAISSFISSLLWCSLLNALFTLLSHCSLFCGVTFCSHEQLSAVCVSSMNLRGLFAICIIHFCPCFLVHLTALFTSLPCLLITLFTLLPYKAYSFSQMLLSKSKVSCLSVCIEPQGPDPGELNTADVRLIRKILKSLSQRE